MAGNTVFRSTGRMAEEAFVRHPRFGEPGFDYYVPPDGQTAIIVEEDGVFVVRHEDGLRHEFEQSPHGPSQWRIARIGRPLRERPRLRLRDDRLSEVRVNHQDAWSRFANDECGGSPRCRITGRIWRYLYDDFGDLVEVVSPATSGAPDGGRVCYRYSTVSHTGSLADNLTEIVDGNGCTYLATEYGTSVGQPDFNRVTVQREGDGIVTFDSEIVFEGDPRYPEYQRSEGTRRSSGTATAAKSSRSRTCAATCSCARSARSSTAWLARSAGATATTRMPS